MRCSACRDDNRSKFLTQTQSGPDVWNVAVGLDFFCYRVWSLDKTIWTVGLAISWAPALGVGTTGRSNNFSIDQTQSQKGFSYAMEEAVTQPGLGPAESRSDQDTLGPSIQRSQPLL